MRRTINLQSVSWLVVKARRHARAMHAYKYVRLKAAVREWWTNGCVRLSRWGPGEAASVKVCRRRRLLSTTNPLHEFCERGRRSPSRLEDVAGVRSIGEFSAMSRRELARAWECRRAADLRPPDPSHSRFFTSGFAEPTTPVNSRSRDSQTAELHAIHSGNY